MNRVVQSVPVGGASLCKTWKGVSVEFGDLQECCFIPRLPDHKARFRVEV